MGVAVAVGVDALDVDDAPARRAAQFAAPRAQCARSTLAGRGAGVASTVGVGVGVAARGRIGRGATAGEQRGGEQGDGHAAHARMVALV